MTTRRRRPQRLALTTPALTTEEIRHLARELIRELAPLAGDADAIRAVLLAWLAREDTARLAMAAMSAVQIMFADCLTRTPLGGWALEPPPKGTT